MFNVNEKALLTSNGLHGVTGNKTNRTAIESFEDNSKWMKLGKLRCLVGIVVVSTNCCFSGNGLESQVGQSVT